MTNLALNVSLSSNIIERKDVWGRNKKSLFNFRLVDLIGKTMEFEKAHRYDKMYFTLLRTTSYEIECAIQ